MNQMIHVTTLGIVLPYSASGGFPGCLISCVDPLFCSVYHSRPKAANKSIPTPLCVGRAAQKLAFKSLVSSLSGSVASHFISRPTPGGGLRPGVIVGFSRRCQARPFRMPVVISLRAWTRGLPLPAPQWAPVVSLGYLDFRAPFQLPTARFPPPQVSSSSITCRCLWIDVLEGLATPPGMPNGTSSGSQPSHLSG